MLKRPVVDWSVVRELGIVLARSGMLGLATESQGIVVAYRCLAFGLDPFEFASVFHIVSGKLSQRADSCLAKFLELGGTYQIVERSPDCAAIRMEIDGREHEFRLTWEVAQGEDFAKDKKRNCIAANYSTPYKRSQMLWARVCSDGVRTMCPQALAGHYTPEECADITYESIDEVNARLTESANVLSAVQATRTAVAPVNPVETDAVVSQPIPSTDTKLQSEQAEDPVTKYPLDAVVTEATLLILRDEIDRSPLPNLKERVKQMLDDQRCKLAEITERAALSLIDAIRCKEVDAVLGGEVQLKAK